MGTTNRRARTAGGEDELALPADASAPAQARAAVDELLAAQGVAEPARRNVLLVVSELVSNAVVHGSRDGDEVGVQCSLGPGVVTLIVSDAARGPGYPELRSLDAQRTGGRGLQLVDRYASSWTERIVNGRREVRTEIPI